MPDTALDLDQLFHVKPGDTITMRFREDAIRELEYIDHLDRTSVVEVNIADRITLRIIRSGGDWGTDPANRTLTVVAGLNWNHKFVADRITSRVIESLEVFHS